MVITGRIGDTYGRKKTYLAGILFLIIGSYGAGYSETYHSLIIFRAIQSIGVAIVATLGPSLICDIFKEKSHFPMSLYGMIIGIAMTLGPFLGGWIVMHWSWRWIFYINIPILIIATVFCGYFLKESKSSKRESLDAPGGGLLFICMGSLIYGLIKIEQAGWSNPESLLLSGLFIIALILLISTGRKKSNPILNFKFFSKPGFSLAVLGCSTGGALITASIFFSPLLLQNVLNYTPKQAGLFLLAIPVAMIFFAPLVSKLIAKINIKNTLILISILGLIATLFHILFSIHMQLGILIIGFLIAGLAWTLVTTATAIGATGAVEASESGLAVGTTFSFWNISSAINLAIATLIFHHQTEQAQSIKNFLTGFEHVFIYIGLIMLAFLITGAMIIHRSKQPINQETRK